MGSEGVRGYRQCFHTHPFRFLSLLNWTPWATTVTLFYHPWIINPFFWGIPQWARELWALFSYWKVGKLRSLGIYPSCYPFKDKTSVDLSFWKLIETFQLVVEGQGCYHGLIYKKRKKGKRTTLHVVLAVSSASFHGILNLPVSLPANSNLGQAASLKSLKEHIGLLDKQTGVRFGGIQRKRAADLENKCEGDIARYGGLRCARQWPLKRKNPWRVGDHMKLKVPFLT